MFAALPIRFRKGVAVGCPWMPTGCLSFTAPLNVLPLSYAFCRSPSPLGSEFPLRGLRLISSKSIYRPFTALPNVLLLPCAFYGSPSPLQERSFLSEDCAKGLYIDLEEIRRCNDLVTGGDLMRCNGIVECDDLMRCDDIMTWDDL